MQPSRPYLLCRLASSSGMRQVIRHLWCQALRCSSSSGICAAGCCPITGGQGMHPNRLALQPVPSPALACTRGILNGDKHMPPGSVLDRVQVCAQSDALQHTASGFEQMLWLVADPINAMLGVALCRCHTAACSVAHIVQLESTTRPLQRCSYGTLHPAHLFPRCRCSSRASFPSPSAPHTSDHWQTRTRRNPAWIDGVNFTSRHTPILQWVKQPC